MIDNLFDSLNKALMGHEAHTHKLGGAQMQISEIDIL